MDCYLYNLNRLYETKPELFDPKILSKVFINASKRLDIVPDKDMFAFESHGQKYCCRTKRVFIRDIDDKKTEHYYISLPNGPFYYHHTLNPKRIDCFEDITQYIKEHFGSEGLKILVNYNVNSFSARITYRYPNKGIFIDFKYESPGDNIIDTYIDV